MDGCPAGGPLSSRAYRDEKRAFKKASVSSHGMALRREPRNYHFSASVSP